MFAVVVTIQRTWILNKYAITFSLSKARHPLVNTSTNNLNMEFRLCCINPCLKIVKPAITETRNTGPKKKKKLPVPTEKASLIIKGKR